MFSWRYPGESRRVAGRMWTRKAKDPKAWVVCPWHCFGRSWISSTMGGSLYQFQLFLVYLYVIKHDNWQFLIYRRFPMQIPSNHLWLAEGISFVSASHSFSIFFQSVAPAGLACAVCSGYGWIWRWAVVSLRSYLFFVFSASIRKAERLKQGNVERPVLVGGLDFFFPYIGNNHPNWLIFFRGVETTNQRLFLVLGRRSNSSLIIREQVFLG